MWLILIYSHFFYCWIDQLNLEWSADVKLGLVRQVRAFGKSPGVGIMYWKCRTDCTSSVFIFMFNSTAVCPEFNSYSLGLNQHAHIVEFIFPSKYQRCVTCLCVIVVIAYLQERVIKWIRYVRTQVLSSHIQKRVSPHSFFPWISDLNFTPAAAICRYFSFAERPTFNNFVRYKIIVSIYCRMESVQLNSVVIGSNPGTGKTFSLLENVQTGIGVPSDSCSVDTGLLSRA